MVYPVSWTADCYVTVITHFIKKVGVVRPNFGAPDSPSDCALVTVTLYTSRLRKVTDAVRDVDVDISRAASVDVAELR